MPGPEHADEANDEPPVKLQTLSDRLAVQVHVEQTRIRSVGQNVNALGSHSGVLQQAAERFRNHD